MRLYESTYRPSRRAPLPSFPPPLPSFPRKRESRTVLPYNAAVLASHRGIPAYAGRTGELVKRYNCPTRKD